jgi:Flp pilus assembly protein TadD
MLFLKDSKPNQVTGESGSHRPGAAGLGKPAIVGAALLLSLDMAQAQDAYQQAEAALQAGNIQGMATAYQRILDSKPDDQRARLGYATAQSWLGNNDVAQQEFRKVLQQQPGNLEALTGLGYSQAWSRQFDAASETFEQALKQAPDNLSAQKGLALTMLWSGQNDAARERFQILRDSHPRDAEILSGLGQAELASGLNEDARASFSAALSIEPGRADAADGLARIAQLENATIQAAEPESERQHKGIFDLSISFGDSSNGGDTGLREVFAAYAPNDKLRYWLRYDDSLSLDNPGLVRSGQKAETWYVGLQHLYLPNWLGVVEVGQRQLPNAEDQQIYKLETVRIEFDNTLKFGLQVSPHSAGFSDKLVYAGYGFNLTPQWKFEPTLYLAKSGALQDDEWRAVGFAEYHASERWSAGVGAGFGQISSSLAAADGSVSTANGVLTYALNKTTRVNFSLRYEDTPSNSFTTTLVGVAVQLPR